MKNINNQKNNDNNDDNDNNYDNTIEHPIISSRLSDFMEMKEQIIAARANNVSHSSQETKYKW